MLLIRENIPSKELKPTNMKNIIKINLKKMAPFWGIKSKKLYQQLFSFKMSWKAKLYSSSQYNIILLGDFNIEPQDKIINNFC